MITLPTEITKAKRVNPHLSLLFGPTKSGKTTKVTELPDCLIIDSEEGTKYIDSLKVDVESWSDVTEVVKALRKSDHRYTYIALDTIDNIIEWAGDDVKDKYQIKDLSSDFAFGYQERNRKIITLIEKLMEVTDHLLLIGHEEIKDASDLSDTWERKSIDIGGKLGRLLSAKADAIGRVFRKPVEPKEGDENTEPEEQLYISFKPSESTIAGSRCKHLRGQVFPFDWDKVFLKE